MNQLVRSTAEAAARSVAVVTIASVLLVGCGGNNADGGTDSNMPGVDSSVPGTDGETPGFDSGVCPPPGVTLNMMCDPALGTWGAILFFTVDADMPAAAIGIDQIQIDFDIAGSGFNPFLDPDPVPMPAVALTFPHQTGIQACSPTYGTGNATVTGLMGGVAVAEANATFDGQDCIVTNIPVTLSLIGPDPCGDGMCDGAGGENNCSCPMDCVVSCGDTCCSAGEMATCPADCP